MVNPRRVRELSGGSHRTGPVIYWMSRDQRARDNWALLHALELARGSELSAIAAFCLAPSFPGATLRHYDFMLEGLRQTARELKNLGIPFTLLMGEPADEISRLARKFRASRVVCDFDPLKIKRAWQRDAAEALDVPLIQVDAHNVVPAWIASDKQEYAARTIRPKIHKLLSEFLEDFPNVPRQTDAPELDVPDWDKAMAYVAPDESVTPVKDFEPGADAAEKLLHSWVSGRIRGYAEKNNDPAQDSLSGLSPYLHFGQIAPQRAALTVAGSKAPQEDAEAFLEQLIVRRELADNFCLYNDHYDSPEGWPDWAAKTLDDHRGDEREFTYSYEHFEAGRTHSALWNAAQNQMARSGKMHGYMRMFWAKKILEWSESPERALDIAIRLNDRYELDGRDPNGYVGCMWSIGGVHDHGWKERPIFGKIRYMNERGCRRKFDVDEYVRMWT